MTCGRGYHQDEEDEQLNVSAERGIPRYRIHELCRELAAGEMTRAALARKYGVARSAITQFADRHKARIEEIRANLDDEFAGLWIAQKQNRLGALQEDFELASNSVKAGHHEWVKARIQIAHAVAEELGQLPNRSQITIGGTVRHELVGVDVAECFPAAEEPEEP